jgi:hypothetical protein
MIWAAVAMGASRCERHTTCPRPVRALIHKAPKLSTDSGQLSTLWGDRRESGAIATPRECACGAFRGGDALRLLGAALRGVVEVEGVDKVAEDRHRVIIQVGLALLLGLGRAVLGCRLGGDSLLVLVEEDAGLVEDMGLDEDRHIGAYSQSDRIAGARIDLEGAPVVLEDDPGKEGAILNIADQDMAHLAVKLGDQRLQEIVGHRALGLVALDGHGDRVGLEGPDPDRQIALAIDLTEHNHAMLREQAHSDAINHDTDHRDAFREVVARAMSARGRAICSRLAMLAV